MRVKLPHRIAVEVHNANDISLMKQSRKYNVPDEELISMTADEAIGLAMVLLKSAHGEITVSHPDKLR